MVIRGFPLPVYNTNNYCVGTRNHCVSQYPSKNYWKTTLRAPCLSGVPPPPSQHKQSFVGIRNHCVVNSPVPTRLVVENNFKRNDGYQGFPLHPFISQTTTVCVHGTTVWVNPLKKLLENNFKGPIFIRPSPPPSQHKQPLCEHTDPQCRSIIL